MDITTVFVRAVHAGDQCDLVSDFFKRLLSGCQFFQRMETNGNLGVAINLDLVAGELGNAGILFAREEAASHHSDWNIEYSQTANWLGLRHIREETLQSWQRKHRARGTTKKRSTIAHRLNFPSVHQKAKLSHPILN